MPLRLCTACHHLDHRGYACDAWVDYDVDEGATSCPCEEGLK